MIAEHNEFLHSPKPEAPPEGIASQFQLPEDFYRQVINLAAQNKELHVGLVVRTLFGGRLPHDQFSKVYEGLLDMVAVGSLNGGTEGTFHITKEALQTEIVHLEREAAVTDVKLAKDGLRLMLAGANIQPNQQSRRRPRRKAKNLQGRKSKYRFDGDNEW